MKNYLPILLLCALFCTFLLTSCHKDTELVTVMNSQAITEVDTDSLLTDEMSFKIDPRYFKIPTEIESQLLQVCTITIYYVSGEIEQRQHITPELNDDIACKLYSFYLIGLDYMFYECDCT